MGEPHEGRGDPRDGRDGRDELLEGCYELLDRLDDPCDNPCDGLDDPLVDPTNGLLTGLLEPATYAHEWSVTGGFTTQRSSLSKGIVAC